MNRPEVSLNGVASDHRSGGLASWSDTRIEADGANPSMVMLEEKSQGQGEGMHESVERVVVAYCSVPCSDSAAAGLRSPLTR